MLRFYWKEDNQELFDIRKDELVAHFEKLKQWGAIGANGTIIRCFRYYLLESPGFIEFTGYYVFNNFKEYETFTQEKVGTTTISVLDQK